MVDLSESFTHAAATGPQCQVDLVDAVEKHPAQHRRRGERKTRAVRAVTTCASRSTSTSARPPAASICAASSRTCSIGSSTGSMPFLKQSLKKMPPNDGAINARKPYSRSARRVLARRPAAEVAVGEQDRRPRPRLAVQDEVRVGRAVADVAQVREQAVGVALAEYANQLAARRDLVGVDVDPHHRIIGTAMPRARTKLSMSRPSVQPM